MLPVKRFVEFVAQNSLFNMGNKILVAVSGGMDSVLMAHLFKAAGLQFGIAHCNFQLRGDSSAADQKFCADLAVQLQAPFHSIAFDTMAYVARQKVSVQMAARQLRYQWFEQIRQQLGYDFVALAHHQNDAIETILLNLTRGTGIAGMHGILPKNGLLVRPLLFLHRSEIQSIIEEEQIAYVEDSSNASVKYARNKIRLEVIPKLKELNPDLENTFQSNLGRFRELETLLALRIAQLKQEIFALKGDDIILSLGEIKKLEPKRLLLFHLLQEYGFNETVTDDLIAALEKHPGRVFESAGYVLLLDRDSLILAKKTGAILQPVIINPGDHNVDYGEYKLGIIHDDSALIIKNNPLSVSVDAGLLKYPLTLRAWQQGDHFYPLGMRTRKKVSDLFINQKVPLHKKARIPILVNGDGTLVWIGGYRPDDRFKVTANTKKVTIFELYKPA